MKNSNVFKPSWRKVLADLGGDWSRTILIIASIAIGVSAVGAIITMYSIFGNDIGVSYASAQPANIEVVTDSFDEALIKAIERIPGVAGAEGRQLVSGRISADGENWKLLDVTTIKDFTTAEMNLLEPIRGTTVPNDRELLIRHDIAIDAGLDVGDEAFVELPDGTVRSMPVKGIVGDQFSKFYTGSVRGYATLDTAEWLGGSNLYNRLYVQVVNGDDEASIESIAAEVEDQLERAGGAVIRTRTGTSTEHPAADTVLAIVGVSGVLGILIMLLSSSLIVNTLNALLSQHRRQIGVMKLVGARGSTVSAMYIALILSYGLIAFIIAVPLGVVVGYGISVNIAGLLGFSIQSFRIVPIAIIVQVMLALGVPLIAGYFPINRGSRMTVRRAISEENPVEQGSDPGLLDNLGSWFKWLSRPILLSIRNTFRRKGRMALTLFAFSIAGAVFIAVFNVQGSLNASIAASSRHFMADVMATMQKPYRTTQVEQVAYQIPGVEHVEAWGGTSGKVVDANGNELVDLTVLAPPVGSTLADAELLAGRWLEPEDQKVLTVSDSIYNFYPDFQPGDTLTVDLPGKRAEEWEAVGVFRFNSEDDVMAYANNEIISRSSGMPGQAAIYRIATDVSTLERQEQVSVLLNQALQNQGFKVGNVGSGLAKQEEISQQLNTMITFLMLMAALSAIVGSIGLMGTMGMNVLERTREIGVMRAIGAVDIEIMKSVVIEGLMIGLISWLIAIPLSFPISSILLNMVVSSIGAMNSSMALVISWQGYFIWLGIVVILSAIASVLPARNAARLTIREVLAYE